MAIETPAPKVREERGPFAIVTSSVVAPPSRLTVQRTPRANWISIVGTPLPLPSAGLTHPQGSMAQRSQRSDARTGRGMNPIEGAREVARREALVNSSSRNH